MASSKCFQLHLGHCGFIVIKLTKALVGHYYKGATLSLNSSILIVNNSSYKVQLRFLKCYSRFQGLIEHAITQ